MEWTQRLLDLGAQLLPWVGSVLMALLTRYVFKKTKNESVSNLLARATAEIGDVAKEVAQVYVDALKKGTADGKLTDQEKRMAKNIALQKIKDNLGPTLIPRLIAVLGDANKMESWIETKLEASIRELKSPSSGA